MKHHQLAISATQVLLAAGIQDSLVTYIPAMAAYL